jgi:predicted PolB exonuclease-like 3'-5' exonuclease
MKLMHFDIETCGNYPDWDTFKIKDPKGSELFEKKYNKIFKDDAIEEAYLNKSPIISTYGKICCISMGFHTENGSRINSISSENEEEIINTFNQTLIKIDKKGYSLSGYRIKNFDIPWVLHKMHKYKIKPSNLIRPYFKKPWELRVVDLAEDWKQRFAWASTFDEVCYELGIPSPKEKMDGSKVHKEYFKGNLDKIVEYCEMDIKSSIELERLMYI